MQTKNIVIVAEDGASRRTLISKLVGIGYQVAAHSRDYFKNQVATHEPPRLLVIMLGNGDSELAMKTLIEEAEKRYASVIFTGDKALKQKFLGSILAEKYIFIPIDAPAKDFLLVLGTAALTAQNNHREQSLRKIHWAISAFGTITRTEPEASKALKGILGAVSAITHSRCDITQAHRQKSSTNPSDHLDHVLAYDLDSKGHWQLHAVSKHRQKFSEDDVQILMMAGAICSKLI